MRLNENRQLFLDRFIVQFCLQLLVVGDLAHTFQEILLNDVVSLSTDCKHS